MRCCLVPRLIPKTSTNHRSICHIERNNQPLIFASSSCTFANYKILSINQIMGALKRSTGSTPSASQMASLISSRFQRAYCCANSMST